MTGCPAGLRPVGREGGEHAPAPPHSHQSDAVEGWERGGVCGDVETVLDRLGTDFHGLCWCWPSIYPGQSRVVREDSQTRVIRDQQGKLVRYWKDKSGTPEHLGFECDSPQKWHEQSKPRLLETGLQIDPASAQRAYKSGRQQGRWCYLAGVESFEQTRSIMGDKITLMAMAEEPEWVADVSRTCTDQVMRNFDAVMAH